MEISSPKIYDIQLVINNIEVGGSTSKVKLGFGNSKFD